MLEEEDAMVLIVRDVLLRHTELATPDAIGVAHLIVDALREGTP